MWWSENSGTRLAQTSEIKRVGINGWRSSGGRKRAKSIKARGVWAASIANALKVALACYSAGEKHQTSQGGRSWAAAIGIGRKCNDMTALLIENGYAYR